MKLPEIDAKKFYTLGKYTFFGIAVLGIVGIIDQANTLEAYELLSRIGSTLFQFLLFGFFAHLAKGADVKELDDKDLFKMNEALDKLNLEEEKNNGKKKG